MRTAIERLFAAMSFAGKVVVITGASSGIGATTAELFAGRGAKLAIVGRNAQNLEATELNCRKVAPTVDVLSIIADITTDAEKVIEKTIAKYGRLDVLVNNAGILALGGIEEVDLVQFDDVLNTNLRAVFVLTKAAVPHLIKTSGNIVNVSSCDGLRAFPSALSYGVSKAALDQFTRCCALDLAPKNVRVNSVNPGVVITDIHRRAGISDLQYATYLERCKETHAMGRVGTTLEVAEAIAFLASNASSFITGAMLPIDGGKQLMCPK